MQNSPQLFSCEFYGKNFVQCTNIFINLSYIFFNKINKKIIVKFEGQNLDAKKKYFTGVDLINVRLIKKCVYLNQTNILHYCC